MMGGGETIHVHSTCVHTTQFPPLLLLLPSPLTLSRRHGAVRDNLHGLHRCVAVVVARSARGGGERERESEREREREREERERERRGAERKRKEKESEKERIESERASERGGGVRGGGGRKNEGDPTYICMYLDTL
jgi:hypothetical protein